jgi:hypothetical protein
MATNMFFDRYDTSKLEDALVLLNQVYEYNYDSSRKEKLLATVINKLEYVLDQYSCREDR